MDMNWIKPIEPVEPMEPLEPIGGAMAAADAQAEEAAGAFMETKAAEVQPEGSKKKKKISIYDVTPENDIKFKGFLSYRHFRIMGWICMAIAVMNIFLSLGMKISEDVNAKYETLNSILSFFAQFAIFLFLFANFAVIIDKKSTYKSLFITYGGLTVAFIVIYNIIYYRYLLGIVKSVGTASGRGVNKNELLGGGFFTFNVFLDLLLCTAVVFFIDYRPKKWFVGKKLYIFRAFTVIPIIYEVACMIIKYYAVTDGKWLHPMVSPFLTTKPIMCFLLFLRMAFYVKGRESKFLKHGRTVEDYNAFLKTNRNSFEFSKKFALMTLIYGAIDFVIAILLVTFRLLNAGALDAFNSLEQEEAVTVSTLLLDEVARIGFGSSVMMILFVPFILLFSYTKSYRKSKVDTLIPIGAVVVIGLIILEGIFRVLCLIPDKINTVLSSIF